ncbi:MAG: YceI family protein [Candidatus Kapabacteria bacterium]|nr:YceI family protein [Candidatus Kapabacteria bacterium]
MRIIVATLALLVVVSSAVTAGTGISGAQTGAKKYSMNNAVGKSGVEFVSEAPMEKINGTADGVSGSFSLDPTNLEATTGRIEVQVTSMKTANSKRDGHMYSEMWLDADAHPTVAFEVKSLKDVKVVTKDGKSTITAKAVGVFTCHGVAKASTADVTITYIPASAETAKRASGNLVMIDTKFVVALADHQIAGKAGIVGKSVGETIAVEAKLFANS